MIDKFTKKTEKIKSTGIFDIPDSIIPEDKRLFLPNWDNRPPEQKSIVKLKGNRVLTTGNILALVSRAGTGKSSVCEAIISNLLNPKSDSLGFETSLPIGRDKVLYIDTERTIQDTWNSWQRTYNRSFISYPDMDNRLIFANFKSITVLERKKNVEEILKNNKDIGLVIFDGAGDFIRDTNSIQETGDFIDWINTFNSNISIFVTLHTNPKDNKPRGHLGSELCRRAESVLLIRKIENGIREITTDFEHGKVRNDNDLMTSYYEYSNENNMFISADYSPKSIITNEKLEDYRAIANQIFEGKTILSTSSIIKSIESVTNKNNKSATNLFYRYFKDNLLKSTDNGYKLA